ncbi:multiple C2 and transmembrane domain-containing protein 2 [Puma concolor]|uniref:Multiple C2 and transmembrane domain-containing protein 2 n=1 Tax=Puma concolor TaxID=9696 RepID=A0A6P6HHV8_PUMCO|nr:multiple C2 and transmembrane domain-containing protein 2 [Puma concolor]
MDMDKPSVWGSLKQRTRPLLINLSKRKVKKNANKPLDLRARRPLDRRLSLSVPDLLEAEALAPEGRPYSGPQSSYTSVPSSLSTAGIFPKSSSSSLKQSEEELDWSQEEAGHLHVGETDSEEAYASPAEDRRPSSNDILDLLQKTPLEEDALEEPEKLCGSGDLNASLTSQQFEERSVSDNALKANARANTIDISYRTSIGGNAGLGATQILSSWSPPCSPASKPVPSANMTSVLLRVFAPTHISTSTSDPYVKFKLNGKTLYKSKVVYKNLNPVWDEVVALPIQSLDQKLRVKVYDRDLTTSDFMGSAFVILRDLELNRTTEHILKLEDPNSLEEDMGVIVLNLNLGVKQCDFKRHRWSNRKRLSASKSSLIRNLRLSESLKKNQLWNGIISITLLEGKNVSGGSMTEMFVQLKLGDQRYKSKRLAHRALDLPAVAPSLLSSSPEVDGWRVWYPRNIPLVFSQWRVTEALLTFPTTSDTCHRCDIASALPTLTVRSPRNLVLAQGARIGYVSARIQRIQCPKAPPEWWEFGFPGMNGKRVILGGKSDPFCLLELGNDRLQTHTIYKNLNPEWNKVFTFPIKDIHDVLEVTVFDEDGDKPPDFLGKVAIPLLSIRDGRPNCYILKNKDLEQAFKGAIYLEMDLIYNPVKASIRTFTPREKRFVEDSRKLSKKILSRDVDRVKRITMAMWNTIQFLKSCFQWESTLRSAVAFVVFLVAVWNFELYMIPLALLLLFIYNFIILPKGKTGSIQDSQESTDVDEEEYDDDKESEKKGLIERIYMVQDIVSTVQNILEEIASFGERIKNTFNWTVPFLSFLACLILAVATVTLYFIPLRYIVLIWENDSLPLNLPSFASVCPWGAINTHCGELGLPNRRRPVCLFSQVQYAELRPCSSHSPLRKKRSGV